MLDTGPARDVTWCGSAAPMAREQVSRDHLREVRTLGAACRRCGWGLEALCWGLPAGGVAGGLEGLCWGLPAW